MGWNWLLLKIFVILAFFFTLNLEVNGSWTSLEAASTWALSESRKEVLESDLLESSIQNAWWVLAAQLVKWSKQEHIDISHRVKASVARLQKEAVELLNLLDSYSASTETFQRLPPAFQWTESETHVYMQIKLAYRWTSPGSLSVENQNVTIQPTNVFFSGVGIHSGVKKLYILDLNLIDEILPNESDWNWGAVGKITLTLKKKIPGLWKSLTMQRISNMHTWFEMKERIKSIEDKRNTTNDHISNGTINSNNTTNSTIVKRTEL